MYITISDGSNVFNGRAPVMGVTIKQVTDYTTHKALNGDILVASFGFLPVEITISGLDLFNMLCNKKGRRIADFFGRHNLVKNSQNRLTVSLSGSVGGTGGTFKCVLTDLTMQATGGDKIQGLYRLNLIGIQE